MPRSAALARRTRGLRARQHTPPHWVGPALVVALVTAGLATHPRRPHSARAGVTAQAAEAPEPVPEKTDPLLWYRNHSLLPTPQVVREWYLIGGVGVNVVWVDIGQPNVRLLVGLADGADPRRGYFPRQRFSRYIERYKPRAAINGLYFHNTSGQPTGSIVRNGVFLFDGRWGTTITIDRQGRVRFHYRSGTFGHDFGWQKDVYQAITTGPTLVRNGKVWLWPWGEGFRDRRVLGMARRSAIGLTWDNKIVLVTVHTPVTLDKLANIMLRFSCKAAANLDGGSSSALYCRGVYVTKPSRAIPNVLLVYD